MELFQLSVLFPKVALPCSFIIRPVHLRSDDDESSAKDGFTVTRAGRHFVVKRVLHGQIVEIERLIIRLQNK
jgi:hypothetical protein